MNVIFHRALRLVVLCFTFWPGLVHAEEPQDPTTEARVLYLKGNAAFRRGDDILARDYYKKSLALRESFDTYCNLGRSEEQSALWSEAYFHLGLCLRFYPEDEDLAGPREKYAALREEIGGKLSPEDMVEIDHRVQTHEPRAQVGTSISEPTAAEAAPVERTQPPPPAPERDAGPRYSPARLPVSLTLGVLGAAGVGVGVGFLVDSQNAREEGSALRERMMDEELSCPEGEDNHSSCERLGDLYDRADRNRVIGIASTAAGGTLLVGSVLLYLLWPERKGSQSARADGGAAPGAGATRGWVQVGQVALRPEVRALSWRGDTFLSLSGRF